MQSAEKILSEALTNSNYKELFDNEDLFKFYEALGLVAGKQFKNKDAIKWADKELALKPNSEKIITLKAIAYVQDKNYNEALNIIQTLNQIAKDEK